MLKWRSRKDDRFIAALALGALHGESHKSKYYFSNRMPRTISTKPAYSLRWWKLNKFRAPERDIFAILRYLISYRFASSPPATAGKIVLTDARQVADKFVDNFGTVTDVITSPPYLDTTNYLEDQWLRLWFLGGEPVSTYLRGDGRHCDTDLYWEFLTEAWEGIAPLLAKKARIVVRIGGKRLSKSVIRDELAESLEEGLERRVELSDPGFSSEIHTSQANSFRGNKVARSVEHDFCFLVN
jgi:hypothetical protein